MLLSVLLFACTVDSTGTGITTPPPPPPPPPPPAHSGWHVSPSGSSSAKGTADQPWSLSYALGGAGGRIQPGDTVWMHGGTYHDGPYVATVAGAPGQPVVIREYPGERAIIDVAGTTSTTARGDAFVVKGAWTIWWGFEMMDSDLDRYTSTRSNMMINYASNTKYINLVIHDGGIGLYTWAQETNVEIYGSIFYNNGWQTSVRGGGHGLYLKSDAGPVLVKDNIMFNQFGYGAQIYSEPGDGNLVNITLDGNVAFNNGSLSTEWPNSSSANLLMGGEVPVQQGRFVNNMTYFSPGTGIYNMRMGFENYSGNDITAQNNYGVGGTYVLAVGYWNQLTATGNRLFGTSHVLQLNDTTLSGFVWNTNTYRTDPLAAAWQYNGVDYGFSAWTLKTGLGLTDITQSVSPATPQVFVRPNAYEPGRATVVVYNWGRSSSVSVDLGGVLPAGASYEVRNVQDLFGDPVTSGTSTNGLINIPMGGVAPPTPIGSVPHMPMRTGPDFDVFIVRKTS
ncbi:MAG TPA: right-handed parallel beta-helix repeat-containing protein [Gemmatimonadales bacterium]|nr:right-handed parallel beta-helix repeat-containing protein [Gemmatimonadales bacterium]